MLNKEIEDNTYKISVPFITNVELNEIDNNLDSIISQFTKQFVHDKELFIAQHIIKKQKEYIDQLENKVKELGKGQHTLMQSRRKWKNRYYKEKRKNEQ